MATKIEEILSQWKIDSPIDELNIINASSNTPVLHCKYLTIYIEHKSRCLKYTNKYAEMKKIRREYYLGNLDKESLDENGWEPFELKIGTKSNIDIYLDADPILIKLLSQISYSNECIIVCNSILKEITARSYHIRNIIDYTKFLAGC